MVNPHGLVRKTVLGEALIHREQALAMDPPRHILDAQQEFIY